MIQKSLGTSLSCTTGGKTVTIGRIKSISELKMDSEMIDTTTLDAAGGFRTYCQGARDAGEMTVEGYLDADEAGQSTLRQLYSGGEAAPFTLSFPDGQTASFTALVKTVWLGAAQVDGVVGFGAALRLSGGVTIS